MSTFESFDNAVKNSLSFLDNEYVSAALALFLILYASLAAPKLPESVARLFDNYIVKFIIFFLIVYIAKKNATIAIIAAIGVMVSIMTLNTYKFNREAMAVIAMGEDMGRRRIKTNGCQCRCGKEECECECQFAMDMTLPKIPNIDNVGGPRELLPQNEYIPAMPPKDYAVFESGKSPMDEIARPQMEEAKKKMDDARLMMEDAKNMSDELGQVMQLEADKKMKDARILMEEVRGLMPDREKQPKPEEMKVNMELARNMLESKEGFSTDNLELLNCAGRVTTDCDGVVGFDPSVIPGYDSNVAYNY
jgi:hypothetical protein